MKQNLTRKIIEARLVEEQLVPGNEIGTKTGRMPLQDTAGIAWLLAYQPAVCGHACMVVR